MDSPLALLAVLLVSVLVSIALQRLRPLDPSVEHRPGRIRSNVAMSLTVLAAGGLAGVLMIAPATWDEDHDAGLLRMLHTPAWVSAIVGFFALELTFYVLHRVEHRWAPLWRIHRAHHTDVDMDVSTSIRSHPLDVVLSNAAFGFVVVLPLGLSPMFLAGYNLVSFGIVWLQHARTSLPAGLDRVLSWTLVTPSNHRMHHSMTRAETDSNYGQNVILFDRLFRTFTTPRTDVRYGIDVPDLASRQSVRAMLLEPLRAV